MHKWLDRSERASSALALLIVSALLAFGWWFAGTMPDWWARGAAALWILQVALKAGDWLLASWDRRR